MNTVVIERQRELWEKNSLGMGERWNIGVCREGRPKSYDFSINFTIF